MLKPSRKIIQNTGIRNGRKIEVQEQLKWNQNDQYIFYKVYMGIG